MSRPKRPNLTMCDYHVTTRIAHKGFMLKDPVFKDYVVKVARDAAAFSGVRLYSWCVMDNHLHILVHVGDYPKEWIVDEWHAVKNPKRTGYSSSGVPVRMADSSAGVDGGCAAKPRFEKVDGETFLVCRMDGANLRIPERDIIKRLKRLYGAAGAAKVEARWDALRRLDREDAVLREQMAYLKRMNSITQYVKTVKESISKEYNRRFDHEGTLWEGRFRSGIVESRFEVLAHVAGYVDFNPVRAKMTRSPMGYRWSSFAAACSGDREAREGYEFFLSLPWREARAVMERIFNARAASIDASKTVPDSQGKVPGSHGMSVKMVPDSVGGVRRRAAEAIKGRLDWMSRAAVIGCREFAKRVALRAPGCLPARILDMFSAFEWDIPVGVA